MICSTCCNALIRKLEIGLDRGQRITCGIDGWGSLQTVVECSHYLATVTELIPKEVKEEEVQVARQSQSDRMKEYWRKKREGK